MPRTIHSGPVLDLLARPVRLHQPHARRSELRPSASPQRRQVRIPPVDSQGVGSPHVGIALANAPAPAAPECGSEAEDLPCLAPEGGPRRPLEESLSILRIQPASRILFEGLDSRQRVVEYPEPPR